jgi:hypothetical protein
MPAAIAYENRVVAFLDILGFRSMVGKFKSDPALQTQLHGALTEIKTYKGFAGAPDTAQKEVEASVFSDSIVISAAADQLFPVIWTCVGLQARLLAFGVLTRGGISLGLTFHKDDVLYGEGLIKAHDLESKTAIYPRVVIDPELIAPLAPGYKAMLLSQDVDGLWHTDPFAFGVLPHNSEALLEDANDPHLVFLEEFAQKIDNEIKAATDVGVAAKWSWLKSKHAEALAFHRTHGKPRLWQIMELTKEAK